VKKINHSVDLAPFEKEIRRGGRAKPQSLRKAVRKVPKAFFPFAPAIRRQVSMPLREKK
jgi:hypothetical protein